MIFVTGDCHSEFKKLSTASFPQQKEMTKKDIVIVCGDFGAVWNVGGMSPDEKYWLRWLDEKPFTTVFVDGNHENFDRLNSEFETVDFHGGKAHKINDSVYHLMRGEVFEFDGKKFFAFGGASSHDIYDGILSRNDFKTETEFKETIRRWNKQKKMFRVENISWWKEELPSDEEIANAENNLGKIGFDVDYVISHCCPQSIVSYIYKGSMPSDKLTMYFEDLAIRLKYNKWFFGHYHEDRNIMGKFELLYDRVIKIV